MLIIISHPEALINEANRINTLFSNGMKLFHLRKPGITERELITLLHQINPEYYAQIALHQHHQLTELFPIQRLHFTEVMRSQLTRQDYQAMVERNMTYSTSIHDISDYIHLNPVFTYTFYGPLFKSISKPGYKPKENALNSISSKMPIQLIGLGGITVQNIPKVKALNYDGAAVLGSIWHSENEVQEFLNLNKTWEQQGHTC